MTHTPISTRSRAAKVKTYMDVLLLFVPASTAHGNGSMTPISNWTLQICIIGAFAISTILRLISLTIMALKCARTRRNVWQSLMSMSIYTQVLM